MVYVLLHRAASFKTLQNRIPIDVCVYIQLFDNVSHLHGHRFEFMDIFHMCPAVSFQYNIGLKCMLIIYTLKHWLDVLAAESLTQMKPEILLVFFALCNAKAQAAEPCNPDVGDSGPIKAAVLQRIWCQSYNIKRCFTYNYPLKKGVPFRTSQANRTTGKDVSVIFYGKEVCIAYMYERVVHSIVTGRETKNSFCRRSCFSKFKDNRVEFEEVRLFSLTFKQESSYKLIVIPENTGHANWKWNLNAALLLFISMFVSLKDTNV